jgi:signal peptidase I
VTELSGSLASFDIVTLARFLSGLGKTGDVLLSRSQWIGELSLDRGRLTGAVVQKYEGPEALEFIASALQGGTFEFSEGPPTLRPTLAPLADPIGALEQFAQRATRWRFELPPPLSVPYRTRIDRTDADDDVQITLDRRALYVLLEVDGRRNVRELVERHGLLRGLRALGQLGELGLVEFSQSETEVEADAGRAVGGRSSGGSVAHRDEQRSTIGRPDTALLTAGAGGAAADVLAQPWVLSPRVEALRALCSRWVRAFARSGATQTVLATGIFVLGMRTVIQNFRVDGVSMEPNYEAGQVLIVNRAAYARVSTHYLFGGPHRGDIVVFDAPPQPGTDYIKRLIGVPGDSVLIRDGQVIVNDQPLHENYVEFPANYTYPPNAAPLIVPDGEYFVLGDNRPESFDSHAGWLVPADNLIGRAWMRYWPPRAFGVAGG